MYWKIFQNILCSVVIQAILLDLYSTGKLFDLAQHQNFADFSITITGSFPLSSKSVFNITVILSLHLLWHYNFHLGKILLCLAYIWNVNLLRPHWKCLFRCNFPKKTDNKINFSDHHALTSNYFQNSSVFFFDKVKIHSWEYYWFSLL